MIPVISLERLSAAMRIQSVGTGVLFPLGLIHRSHLHSLNYWSPLPLLLRESWALAQCPVRAIHLLMDRAE